MRIVIIGAPAAGKSTLTDRLVAADPRLRTFGVRRYFDRQVALGTPLGRAAEAAVRAGRWIADELVAEAVCKNLDGGGLGRAFILEGMPGNRRQAELLDDLLARRGLPLHAAVHVATPAEVCVARATRRLVCATCDGGSHQAVLDDAGRCARCGGPVSRRDTDAADRFAQRMSLHAGLAAPMLDHYRPDRLVEVRGDRLDDARTFDGLLSRLSRRAADLDAPVRT